MTHAQISGFHYHIGKCSEWGKLPCIEKDVKNCLVEAQGVTFSHQETEAQKAILGSKRLCDLFAHVADEHLRFRLYALQAQQNSINEMGGQFCYALRLAQSQELDLRFIRLASEHKQ